MAEMIQRFVQDFFLSVLGLIGGACAIYGIVAITRCFLVRVKSVGLALLFSVAVEDERIASGVFPVCAASAADSAHADFALDKRRSGHRGDESARVRDDAVPSREVERSRRVERLLPLCVRRWLGVPVRHGPSRPRAFRWR